VDITNRMKLVKALQLIGVRPDAYSVSGAEDMALCIDKIGNGWEVFYFERGGKTFSKVFDSEQDACVYMYSELIRDKTSFMKNN
jgi:hypothetical protein